MRPTKKEVLTIAENIITRKRAGHAAYLTDDLDVLLWDDPENSRYTVDSQRGVSLYFACVNHGPFLSEVTYVLAPRKDAIELRGCTKGTMFVPAGRPPPDVNWDYCVALAVRLDSRDDCHCDWSYAQGTILTTAKNIAELQTTTG